MELYKGRVLDVAPDALIVEYGGTEQEVDALIALLGGFGIRELVRTGVVAMREAAVGDRRRPDPQGRRRAGAAPGIHVAPRASHHRSRTDANTVQEVNTLMPARMYYDTDADPQALAGQTVAIIGYGSQGHAHALNLHESGVDVVVGLKPGSKSRAHRRRRRACASRTSPMP